MRAQGGVRAAVASQLQRPQLKRRSCQPRGRRGGAVPRHPPPQPPLPLPLRSPPSPPSAAALAGVAAEARRQRLYRRPPQLRRMPRLLAAAAATPRTAKRNPNRRPRRGCRRSRRGSRPRRTARLVASDHVRRAKTSTRWRRSLMCSAALTHRTSSTLSSGRGGHPNTTHGNPSSTCRTCSRRSQPSRRRREGLSVEAVTRCSSGVSVEPQHFFTA
mmetsp:Transcript_54594/g.108394  ORF Transcript_54594/g.108394 Transcript_54594/m.108394 type:complete len:216 (+) Transcript_54594:1271-1918(+)